MILCCTQLYPPSSWSRSLNHSSLIIEVATELLPQVSQVRESEGPLGTAAPVLCAQGAGATPPSYSPFLTPSLLPVCKFHSQQDLAQAASYVSHCVPTI